MSGMIVNRSIRQLGRGGRLSGRGVRFNGSTSGGSHRNGAIVGGITGAGIALLGGYAWYHFSGTKDIVASAHSTFGSLQKFKDNMKQSAPEPNQALDWVKQTAKSYGAFIPGASAVIDRAFQEVDKLQETHGGQVEGIMQNAYRDLAQVSKDGINIQSAHEAYKVIQKYIDQLQSLASDAGSHLLKAHPELKESVGGQMDDLKNLSQQYGPEGKKKAEELYGKIQEMAKKGLSKDSISDIKKLVNDQVNELKQSGQKFGDEAWSKGLEQAQPYLDKIPQAKKLITENADQLKSSDLGQLWDKVKKASESGNADDLTEYVKKQAGGGGGGHSSIEQYLKMIPGAEQIFPRIKQLQDIAAKHGPEAEKLARESYEEISNVLKKKLDDAEQLGEKAQKEAK